MGAGSSLEAAYTLTAGIPAGTWHLVGDGIIEESVDVTFEAILRRDGAADVPLATWTHHFDPLPGGTYAAQAYEEDAEGARVDFQAKDQLVFRYSGKSASLPDAYIPNGDGKKTGGRIPNLPVPK